ncbi:hypothetical protein N0V90_007226 [Kalmusia sp. IMI 367209]|nr:hypothetical protein N0V90_007226 [Kalmusia sp. IMI 367209]
MSDFGMVWGVAYSEYCDSNDKDGSIDVVTDWPLAQSSNGTSHKVPSIIEYTTEQSKNLEKVEKPHRIGYEIPPANFSYKWMKLGLEGYLTGEAAKLQREQSSKKHPPHSAESLVADYLAQILEHLILNLEKRYPEELWKMLPTTLVVTFPAVWSDSAKHKTLEAFRIAGFNTIRLPQLKKTLTITEPEAAAMHTLKWLSRSVMMTKLDVGDGFTVCDMGGGTVDLISYVITGLNPTTLEEATIGTGEQCGFTFAERHCFIWLEERIGVENFRKLSENTLAKNLSRSRFPPKLADMMVHFFRPVLWAFREGEFQSRFLTLPHPLIGLNIKKKGIKNGELRVTRADLGEMFDFSLKQTRALVEGQLRQADRNQAVKTKGAVIKGLEDNGKMTVKARKCRRHYGTSISSPFDPSKHSETDAYICPYTGDKRATNTMAWHISMGEDLSTLALFHGKCALCSKFWPGERRHVTLSLFASDENSAPISSRSKVSRQRT